LKLGFSNMNHTNHQHEAFLNETAFGFNRIYVVNGLTDRKVLRDECQAFALDDPIGFEVGEAGFCGTGAGNSDEVALGIGETFRVGLEAGAEAAADAISVVGLFGGAFAGDESGADGGQGGICQGADNDKPACFRLAGFSDA
jgi:hypothetical protein